MIRPVILALALASVAAPVAAQTLPAPQSSPQPESDGVEFLPRFDFHLGLEHLLSDERRFVWDAHFGGDLDLIAYRRTRLTFVADYQAVLGSQYQPFDPNQGNYTIGGSFSRRLGAAEVAGVVHHVSRHLGDRPKRSPVDWNMLGGRVRGGMTRGRTDLQARVDLRGVVQKTYVDYRWELDADSRARVALAPRVAAVATGGVRVLGVDGSRGRGTQYGVRGEGGVRLDGRGAALELFVAVERRVDPYQLEFSTATWLTTGFRLVGR